MLYSLKNSENNLLHIIVRLPYKKGKLDVLDDPNFKKFLPYTYITHCSLII